eukprot:CAMPEP_0204877284 /NCGR_PEP_ID=MMETSP1348-20121228/48107_1 /ASSEMBLY_ACC=CAM_ASM_000700 /TAXON_ID=215587 /ORGANISM="Aplanochytrium stocchinoi, Strain GSBS06" /LENGTH=468 /DNA_ID=CAMNT_0052034135 /DNA_START=468 /DNA_END=1874 /DNA_ORIENTATION=+
MIDISYDDYIRTTENRHKIVVQALWKRLQKKGFIYKGYHSGWYCESDEEFLTEKQTELTTSDGLEQRVSRQSGHKVELIEESNYMFRLSAFQQPLLDWLDSNSEAVQPSFRVNEVKSWLSQGLEDLSISRPRERVQWAIPVPNDDTQSIYVWLDALANYLTVSGVDPTIVENAGEDESLEWPTATHIIGKDILRFHAIYWPAFLLAAGFKPPHAIVAHAHWTVDHTKMSKSIGNVVCPKEVTDKYGKSALRYFLLRSGGLVDDSDFSLELCTAKYNDELANTLGNLLSRCTAQKIMNTDTWPHDTSDVDEDWISKINLLSEKVSRHYDRFDVPRAIDTIMSLLKEVNAHFSAKEPWKLAAQLRQDPTVSEDVGKRLDSITLISLHSVRVSAILLLPIVPDISRKLLDVLGIPEGKRLFKDAVWDSGTNNNYCYTIQRDLDNAQIPHNDHSRDKTKKKEKNILIPKLEL